MNNYIVFASWEDRFIEGVKNDIESIKHIYCFYFDDSKFYSRTKEKIEEIEAIAKEKNVVFTKISLKFDKYIYSWKEVKNTFEEMHSDIEYIKLNITTMPRNMIFCMLHFLQDKGLKYDVIYYPAEEHSESPTTNPLKPHIVLQHGGIMYPDKKTVLIVFAGYDRKRVEQLNNYFEPYEIYLVHVKQNLTDTPDNYEDDFDIQNIKTFIIDDPSHENTFSKLNEILTEDILEKYNVLLCSLGAKIESIGIYKFNKLHPETALLYAPSKDYADDYSKGIDLENTKIVSHEWLLNVPKKSNS